MLGLTHGFAVRPRSAAFFARSPAAIRTDGFDVLVQLVIAAITTLPSATSLSGATSLAAVSTLFFACFGRARYASSAPVNDGFTPARLTRSCGRAGPASEGS